jgi:cell division protein FtsQ
LLLIGNLIAGALYSPVTSLRKVRVEGAGEFDQLRLQRLLASLKDVPCAQVNARNIESLALDLPEARSAELTRNPFGSGLLKIRYKRPVARRFNGGNLALTADGVLYSADRLPEDLPTFNLPTDEPVPALALAANWQPARIAELAMAAREMAPQNAIRIDLNPSGVVCLNMGSGRVVLGSTDNLEKKLQVLRERLEQNPMELSEVESLILTSPDNPSVVRKKVETSK